LAREGYAEYTRRAPRAISRLSSRVQVGDRLRMRPGEHSGRRRCDEVMSGSVRDIGRGKRRRMTNMSFLAKLRRRKRALASVVLPLFLSAWFSGASASACPGMAAQARQDVSADTAPPGHDHSHAHQSPADNLPSPHPAEGADHHGQSSHSHGTCPHCLGSSDGPSSASTQAHVVCSVLEDVSDSTVQPGAPKWESKYFLPAVQPVVFSASVRPRRAHDTRRTAPPVYRAISLNIRHCVFLI
jgi:hypothetical protein